MKVHAYAKINWALAVRGRRANGYHDMDMLMQSVDLYDTLIFEEADSLSLSVSGSDLPADMRNLILRAGHALMSRAGGKRGAKIAQIKRIPQRAGMGGGSADAAATLIALRKMWRLPATDRELFEIGASLGADIPFCLMGGLARARGIGEKLNRLAPAPRVWLVLIQPEGGLSTREVFARFDEMEPKPAPSDMDLAQQALLARDFSLLRRHGQNMLEAAALKMCPSISEGILDLYDLGAEYARMTGSGSVVYGVFESEDAALSACRALRPKYPYSQAVQTLPEIPDGI